MGRNGVRCYDRRNERRKRKEDKEDIGLDVAVPSDRVASGSRRLPFGVCGLGCECGAIMNDILTPALSLKGRGGDVIEIENRVDDKAIRHLHLMANHELSAVDRACYAIPKDAKVRAGWEAGVWHLRAEWPYFGSLDIQPEGWNKFRRLVMRAVTKGDRISAAVHDAAMEFSRLFGRLPQYAFMRRLPKGVEPGQIIMIYGREVALFDCEWVPDQCVAVGGAGPVDSNQLSVSSE